MKDIRGEGQIQYINELKKKKETEVVLKSI